MKITYDKKVDAKYVSIKKGKVFKTKSLNESIFYDVNKEGEVLGIEILDSSKNDVIILIDGDILVIRALSDLDSKKPKSIEFKKDYPIYTAKSAFVGV